MPGFWIDIALSFMVYAILIFLIKWKMSYRVPKKRNSDGEGGILIDRNWDPDLDLPPGVTLPISGPEIEYREREEALV